VVRSSRRRCVDLKGRNFEGRTEGKVRAGLGLPDKCDCMAGGKTRRRKKVWKTIQQKKAKSQKDNKSRYHDL